MNEIQTIAMQIVGEFVERECSVLDAGHQPPFNTLLQGSMFPNPREMARIEELTAHLAEPDKLAVYGCIGIAVRAMRDGPREPTTS